MNEKELFVMKQLRNVIVREFSNDGENSNDIKVAAYQRMVDEADLLINQTEEHKLKEMTKS